MRQGFIKDDNTKHISYNIKFLMIQMNQVRSEDNVADLFTKSLPKIHIWEACQKHWFA